jgi:DNA repair protein RecN (Recombination protein N)
MSAELQELRIKNLAIIDELVLEFSRGLTILTGETGAGKSIILGGLSLILGERADASVVRTGCDAATVEAIFSIGEARNLKDFLSEGGFAQDESADELIVRREVSRSGKNRCFINGRVAPLYQVQSLGDKLVDLHGQHQHQSLLSPETQLEVLDAFGDCDSCREAYRAQLAVFRRLATDYRRLQMSAQERERLKDSLRFQINEIEAARLSPDEDESLERERNRLLHAEKLGTGLSEAYDLLYEGEKSAAPVTGSLDQIQSRLAELAAIDPALAPLRDKAEELRISAQDLAFELRALADKIEDNPQRLEQLEQRLEEIKRLKRKYGSTISEIVQSLADFRTELEGLEHSGERLEQLAAELRGAEDALTQKAEELSRRRKRAAQQLEKRIVAELAALNMPKTRFSVAFDLASEGEAPAANTDCPYRFGESGIDRIEFLLTPNPGEELRPLARIASGGEISRIMLALKSIIAAKDRIPILVFDEIDVGISGAAADKIGDKMAKLGTTHQVICITHLPQIAAKATTHYAVEKSLVKSRTVARVRRLSRAERLEEIARLIDGEKVSDIGRRHAEEMLKRR